MSIYDDICKELTGASVLSEDDMVQGYVDSGSYALNRILSGKFDGGYPVGAITEIYGESSTAKTVFLTHAFVGAQKAGYYTVMIDNEQAYSPPFARKLGVDAEKLIYMSPESLEDCFEAIERVVASIRKHDKDTPIVIGYDSIGVSPARKELESDAMGGDNMTGALRAKQAGICLRRINPLLRKEKVALIIINQVRSKVGVMYGDPTTKAGGGNALFFYCGVSLKTSSGKSDILFDDFNNPIGIKGKVQNKKNKVTIPFQECEFKLVYDEGLNRSWGMAEMGQKLGLVTSPAKGWFSLDGGETKTRKENVNEKMEQMVENGEL